jgi:hypothetical protein
MSMFFGDPEAVDATSDGPRADDEYRRPAIRS